MKCVKLNKNTPWCKGAQIIVGMSRDQGKCFFMNKNIKMTLSMYFSYFTMEFVKTDT